MNIPHDDLVKMIVLPGIRGRLLSELGKKGGGCWGRVDADCEDCEDCPRGGAGRGAGTEGGGARAVWGRVSVGLAEGRSGSRLPGITAPAGEKQEGSGDLQEGHPSVTKGASPSAKHPLKVPFKAKA